jgi:plastocyanin
MRVERVGWVRGAVAAIVCALAALAAGAPAHAANVNVTQSDFAYTPASVRIAPGDSVTWVAATPSDTFSTMGGHPLQWPSGPFATFSGAVTSHAETFASAGRFVYRCQLHFALGMTGTVTVSANRPPTVGFTASPATVGRPVTFTSTSSDPDPGQTLTYAWDLDGDGAFDPGATGATATRTYATAGTVTVRLRVTDNNGDVVGPESAEASQAITVAPAQAVAGATERTVLGLVTTSLRRVGNRVVLRLRSAAAGQATVRLRRRGRTLAAGTARFAAASTKSVRLRLTRRGRAALRGRRAVRATLVATFRDQARNATTLSRQVRVRGG